MKERKNNDMQEVCEMMKEMAVSTETMADGAKVIMELLDEKRLLSVQDRSSLQDFLHESLTLLARSCGQYYRIADEYQERSERMV